MTALERSLVDAVDALRRFGARFPLVGGLAVSVRAEPRLTRDADLAAAVGSDDEAERVVCALLGEGYRVLAAVEHEVAGGTPGAAARVVGRRASKPIGRNTRSPERVTPSPYVLSPWSAGRTPRRGHFKLIGASLTFGDPDLAAARCINVY